MPIYVDGTVAVVPLKMGKDHSVLIRPFGWKVWTGTLVSTVVYIIVTGIRLGVELSRFKMSQVKS